MSKPVLVAFSTNVEFRGYATGLVPVTRAVYDHDFAADPRFPSAEGRMYFELEKEGFDIPVPSAVLVGARAPQGHETCPTPYLFVNGSRSFSKAVWKKAVHAGRASFADLSRMARGVQFDALLATIGN